MAVNEKRWVEDISDDLDAEERGFRCLEQMEPEEWEEIVAENPNVSESILVRGWWKKIVVV